MGKCANKKWRDVDFAAGLRYDNKIIQCFQEVLHAPVSDGPALRRLPPLGGAADLSGRVPGVLHGRHRWRRRHHLRAHPSDRLRQPPRALRLGDQQGFRRHRHLLFHRPVYQKRVCGLEALRALHPLLPDGVRCGHLAPAPDAGRGLEVHAFAGAAGGGLHHPAEPGVARRAGGDQPPEADCHRLGRGIRHWRLRRVLRPRHGDLPDDYFYPGSEVGDAASYAAYGADFPDIGDWRRENTNLLVQGMDEAVHRADPGIEFGISPTAIWANKTMHPEGSENTTGFSSYFEIYADSKKWVESGWVDYIAPQLYWQAGDADNRAYALLYLLRLKAKINDGIGDSSPV